MANVVQVELQNLVNGWLGISAYTAAVGPMKLRLYTSASSSTAPGTEVAGGSYVQQTIAFGAPTAATPSVSTNNALISFTAMPACTVTDIGIWDSAGTPIRRAFGALSASKTVGAGDTLSFSIASLSASLV